MKFSIAVPSMRIVDGQYLFDPKSFVEECVSADQAGFYSATVGERRIGVTAYCTSSSVLAGLALSNTENLSFAPSIIQLPLRNPIDVIQEACVFNAAYPGRYRLGVGAGYNQHEFEMLGVPLSARGSLMESGLQIINQFRNGSMFVDVGRGKVPALDPALGSCKPEVWVGAWTVPGVKRTARLADGWMVDPMRTISAVKNLAEVYRSACREVGKKPRISLLREAWIAGTDEDAIREYAPHLVHAHAEYFPRMQGGWKDESDSSSKPYDVKLDPWIAQMNSKEDLSIENLIEDRILVGSVETWIKKLDDWSSQLGMEEVVLRLRFQSGPNLKRTIEAIKEIGEKVLPRYKDVITT